MLPKLSNIDVAIMESVGLGSVSRLAHPSRAGLKKDEFRGTGPMIYPMVSRADFGLFWRPRVGLTTVLFSSVRMEHSLVR